MKLTADIIYGFSGSVLSGTYDEPAPTPSCHREWWELCCSNYKRVAIAAPRGHAKSTAITKAYTLASALFRDRQFILIISDTYKQATLFLGGIKTELLTNKALIDLFGIKELKVDREDDIVVEMKDGYQFKIMALGSEQKVRGLLWNNKRPDLAVGDDLENDEIVQNPDRREKFRNWVSNALLPCLSERGVIRIVGTILHMDSALERLMPKDHSLNTFHDDSGLVVRMKRPIGGWMALRYAAHGPDGRFDSILWPVKWTERRFRELQDMFRVNGNPEGYYQEYLNRPIDPYNAFFQDKDFQDFDDRDRESGFEYAPTYCSLDLAVSTDTRRDWCVFGIGSTGQSGVLYLRHIVRDRMDPVEIVDTVLRLQERYKFTDLLIGKGTLEKAIGPFLKEKLARTGKFINIVPIPENEDKRARATSIRGRMRAGGVKFDKRRNWYPEFEAELKQFDRGTHDDQVDMMSLFGLFLNKLQDAPSQKEIEEEEWQKDYGKDYEELHFNQGRSRHTGY